ncbi:MAG: tripartite tricarboxylate transporter substrate binding protein [Burkholderiales bacterium]|nr:tripartite tricarboxylate transporter substrate binding protein [Burkholderiales bacterium]
MNKVTRRNIGRGALALASSLALAGTCHAQSAAKQQDAYPGRPMRMIVPFAPGAGADLTGRTVAQKLSETLGQPVVVENRAGANGIIGTEAALKSPADGYTLLLTARDPLGINPSLYRKLPYDSLTSFEYVSIAAWGPYVLVVNPKVPAGSLSQVAALARAKPGALNYGSFGAGSLPHIGFEGLKANLGIDMVHVPYKSASLAVTGALAGEVEITATSAAGVIGHVRSGKLRAIAVGSPKRLALLPDVPTLAESGVAEDVLPPTFFAFVLAAGTPRPIVARLSSEIHRIVQSKEVSERLVNAGLVPFGSTPEEMAEIVKRDVARFARAVKAIGIQPE